MNKRGDKVISVYWFAILIIVAGGIFAMVYLFYGTPYDIREVESNLLINNIADCVSYAGQINANFISNGEFFQKTGEDIFNECHLAFDSSEWDEEQYYTEVNFYKLEDLNNPVLNFNAGNNKWISSCDTKDKDYERLAKCLKKSFYSIDDLGNQYIIKVLSVVRKSEKNVKI